ncbi:hypothetical protein Bca4012_049459 [Brassica carinata]
MATTPKWIMVGGEGPESYNQNSSYQRALLEEAKENMSEAIKAKLSLDLISDRFSVADFGCASGPNTFVAVQNIIDAVEDKYRKETGQNPAENIEFQVLFNDFTTNDFNTLFQSLSAGRRYYSAGVPGSFFERVLPKESFHIGVINYAFHFTSKIPKGITDRDSPSWNRDMHCTGFNKAVKKAYLDQYSADTKILLDARADELVPGGLMLLFGSCLRDGVKMSETSKGIVLDAVGASLDDLAQQVVDPLLNLVGLLHPYVDAWDVKLGDRVLLTFQFEILASLQLSLVITLHRSGCLRRSLLVSYYICFFFLEILVSLQLFELFKTFSHIPHPLLQSLRVTFLVFQLLHLELKPFASHPYSQGVIEQDKVDSFSTPLYFAEESELKQIIEENGRFTIEAFEDIIHAKGEFTLDPKVLAVSCRASFGTFLSQHFGEQVFTKVFDLIEAKLRQEIPRLLNAKPGMQYLIVLRKKN